MNLKTTVELEHMIEENPKTIGDIFKNTKSAKILLNQLIEEKGFNSSRLGSELGIANYVYEITNLSSKKQPSRKKLLYILIYLKVELELINKILQGFGYSKIYVKVPEDALIFYCIKQGYDLDETNKYLSANGSEILS